jgi:hypothetical protein
VADQVPSGGLTPVEQSLLKHVCRGEWLNLAADHEVVDEAAMRSWGEDRTCRATVIRDILRGRLASDPDPHGLRLRGARISGQLDPENLSTDVNLELSDCLLEDGVLARDARLGSVRLAGCQMEQRAEPPLNAVRLTCNVLDLNRARITGHAERGAVRLPGAHIGGQLSCDGAELRNDSGPALAADGLQVDGVLFLRGEFTAAGDGADDVAVKLTGARVGGTLFIDDPACLKHAADPHRRLAVNGLTYAGVPEQIRAGDWLKLLRCGTPGYAAQPYQQIAAGYRALGDERQAREILMAQRDDELARAGTRWPERLWGRITKVTLGYGYQPWRALLFLAGVVVVSCVLAVVLGAHGALAQTDKTATPGRSCTVVQQVTVGLDLNLPVGTSLARAKCDLTMDSASATAVTALQKNAASGC